MARDKKILKRHDRRHNIPQAAELLSRAGLSAYDGNRQLLTKPVDGSGEEVHFSIYSGSSALVASPSNDAHSIEDYANRRSDDAHPWYVLFERVDKRRTEPNLLILVRFDGGYVNTMARLAGDGFKGPGIRVQDLEKYADEKWFVRQFPIDP